MLTEALIMYLINAVNNAALQCCHLFGCMNEQGCKAPALALINVIFIH